MTYAFVLDIPGPIELYRTAHAEFLKYPTDDLLLHLARPTEGGRADRRAVDLGGGVRDVDGDQRRVCDERRRRGGVDLPGA